MSGLDRMLQRLNHQGGDVDGRIVKGKYNSFFSALKDSYQGEWITIDKTEKIFRCLLNPSKLTEEKDQKVISIDFDAGLQVGDTFVWNRLNSHWMIYMQHVEEEAYYRAEVLQCDYQLGNQWVYIKGPTVKTLSWKKQHNLVRNEMNYDLVMYVSDNEEMQEATARLNIFKFDGHNWQVQERDKYSQTGIIEVYLKEYADNEDIENMREITEYIPEIVKPTDPTEPYIEGPQYVEPFAESLVYSIKNAINGSFVVNCNKVKIDEMTNDSIKISILTGRAMNFKIAYIVDDAEVATYTVSIESM